MKIAVELYKPPVSSIFDGLPGYNQARQHNFKENDFWAIVIPEPKSGTPKAEWIAPVPADPTFPIRTMGTQPLPANKQEFQVKSICIKGYKYNPYFYNLQPPQGGILGPIPDPRPPIGGEAPLLCRSLTPMVPGIGIWIVTLKFDRANKLPRAPPGREAVFEAQDSVPGVEHATRQPFMILGDDPRPKYVAYYDCTGWNSTIEVMNLQNSRCECLVTLFGRSGFQVREMHLSLEPQETKRINLDSYTPRDEGLIVIEPFENGQEFPTTLIIRSSLLRTTKPQFVPFTRIP